MPNGYGHKEYGEHEYDVGGTSNCKHGCGCWMGPSNSGGPTGLDPFGKCPKNPTDGQLLGGKADYDYVVTERIENLESRCRKAEDRLEKVSPGEAKLAEELASVKEKLAEKEQLLAELRHLIGTSA